MQKGSVALLPLLVILFVVVAVGFFLFKNNPFSLSGKNPTNQSTNTPVSLKKDYQNPFDKNSQYINPFSGYKNPFDSLK